MDLGNYFVKLESILLQLWVHNIDLKYRYESQTQQKMPQGSPGKGWGGVPTGPCAMEGGDCSVKYSPHLYEDDIMFIYIGQEDGHDELPHLKDWLQV